MPETALSEYIKDRYHQVYGTAPTSRSLATAAGDELSHDIAARLLRGDHAGLAQSIAASLAKALRTDTEMVYELSAITGPVRTWYVRVPYALDQQLRARADQQDRPLGDLIRDAATQYLINHGDD